jgi:hypothetical protein
MPNWVRETKRKKKNYKWSITPLAMEKEAFLTKLKKWVHISSKFNLPFLLILKNEEKKQWKTMEEATLVWTNWFLLLKWCHVDVTSIWHFLIYNHPLNPIYGPQLMGLFYFVGPSNLDLNLKCLLSYSLVKMKSSHVNNYALWQFLYRSHWE